MKDLSSEEEYNKIKKYIERSIYNTNAEKNEDLASEVYLYRLEEQKHTQHYSYSIIDCLRKHSGRKGTLSYFKRQQLKEPSSIDDVHGDEGATRSNVDERGDSWQYLRRVKGIDRACFILKNYWGFLEAEIGNLFGVSESRVSQRIKRVQSSLSAEIKKEEQRAKRKAKRIQQRVLQKETGRNEWPVEQSEIKEVEIVQSW